MSHARTQIRTAAASALTGLTTSGARVYSNRLYAMDTANLPGLRISLDNETVQTDTVDASPIQDRQIELVVECCAKANTALDDTCDAMQLEVEKALAGGLTISGKHLTVVLASSSFDDALGLTPVAVLKLVFIVSFFTRANAPDTFI